MHSSYSRPLLISYSSSLVEVPTRQLYISVSYQRRIFPIDTENFTPSFFSEILWSHIAVSLPQTPQSVFCCLPYLLWQFLHSNFRFPKHFIIPKNLPITVMPIETHILFIAHFNQTLYCRIGFFNKNFAIATDKLPKTCWTSFRIATPMMIMTL